jgi:hypothetical protein
MARKEEIEILISEDGYLKYHLREIKGAKCLDIAKAVAKALGQIKESNLTSEYYEEDVSEKNQSQQKLKGR